MSLQGFYIRRIRRLAPALLAAVAGFTAISAWKYQNDPHALARSLRGSAFALTSTTNIADSWHIFGGGPAPISHTWSLGLEDQFYLVWPPLMLLILARYRQRVAVAVLVLVSAAVVVNASTLEASGGLPLPDLVRARHRLVPHPHWVLAALALHTDAGLRTVDARTGFRRCGHGRDPVVYGRRVPRCSSPWRSGRRGLSCSPSSWRCY